MSWDAYLIDDRGHEEGFWNYTHNCNPMIEAALGEDIEATTEPWWQSICTQGASPLGRCCWWELLHGAEGPEGAALLDRVIRGLEAEPARFRAMNPQNGWGDYDSLLKVLTEMRNAVPEWLTKWKVHG